MSLFWKRGFAAVLVACAVLSQQGTVLAQALTFTTLAGADGGRGSDDGSGSAARFSSPQGVATDRSGNVYVADSSNHTIRKITPAGAVTTLAGLAGASGSADGTGSTARFSSPAGVAVDSSDNVYVADTDNNTIRRITPGGVVTTLAGLAGSLDGTAPDGTGSVARFDHPKGVATDRGGIVYVADTGNHTIRKIIQTGEVTTLAGLAPGPPAPPPPPPALPPPVPSGGSADGTGSAARFKGPTGVAVDSNGNIYVADRENNTIRKVTPAGVVTTLAGLAGAFGGVDGTGSAARFALPQGVATDGDGNIYVAGFQNQTVRKISPEGSVTSLAGVLGTSGSADGPGSAARFNGPSGVATDPRGNVFVIDSGNHTVRRIAPDGSVATLAGLVPMSGSTDGAASAARFDGPAAVAADAAGNVYVADVNNHTIRKITRTGFVTTLAGLAGSFGSIDGVGTTARFYLPRGVATDSGGNVYVADNFNSSIRKITPAGAVTTLAGRPRLFFDEDNGSVDGTGSAAEFSGPTGLATDGSGNVYVTDRRSHTLRKITPGGKVTTLAGFSKRAGFADGTGNTARFDSPTGVATDSSGSIYVADTDNHLIRKCTAAGVVTTLAGAPLSGSGSTDGAANVARFRYPSGVATDGSGNVYVADSANHTIRKITPGGTVTTEAGLAGVDGGADGTGGAARFSNPAGVATDRSGTVYVADTDNNKIRVGTATLADAAAIDVATGLTGSTRLLGTSPQTATSWQWSVARRPVDAVAELSSATVRNPLFTPDVPGLYTFRLLAVGASATSITTVDLMVGRAPSVPRRRAIR